MGFCIARGFVFCHRIGGFSSFSSDSLVIFFISRNGSPDDASARQSPIQDRHHEAYKVLAVLIPDSVQQLPALFKFRLQFMDLFAKQIHGITISFIQLYSMTCRLFCFIENHLRKIRKARSPHIPVMLSGINPSDFMNTLFPDNFILCQKPGKEAVLESSLYGDILRISSVCMF